MNRAFHEACEKLKLGRWLYVAREEEIPDDGRRWRKTRDGRWRAWDGPWLHDLRRVAVRNLIRAGVPSSVACEVTGQSPAILERYNIVDERDVEEAVEKVRDFVGPQVGPHLRAVS